MEGAPAERNRLLVGLKDVRRAVQAKLGRATLRVSFGSSSPPGARQPRLGLSLSPTTTDPAEQRLRFEGLLGGGAGDGEGEKRNKDLVQQQLQAYFTPLIVLDQICIIKVNTELTYVTTYVRQALPFSKEVLFHQQLKIHLEFGS